MRAGEHLNIRKVCDGILAIICWNRDTWFIGNSSIQTAKKATFFFFVFIISFGLCQFEQGIRCLCILLFLFVCNRRRRRLINRFYVNESTKPVQLNGCTSTIQSRWQMCRYFSVRLKGVFLLLLLLRCRRWKRYLDSWIYDSKSTKNGWRNRLKNTVEGFTMDVSWLVVAFIWLYLHRNFYHCVILLLSQWYS